MKQMIYDGKRKSELLNLIVDGEFLGAVVNTRGSHPCAYIQFPGIEKVENYNYFYLECGVHGGFTFLGDLDHLGLNGLWLGWDYAHCGDYTQPAQFDPKMFEQYLLGTFDSDEKKWTTEEITEEVKIAIQCVKEGRYEIDEEQES